jgi:hypothetical protein
MRLTTPTGSVALTLLAVVRPLRGLHQAAISKMSNILFTKRTSSLTCGLHREAMSSADHPHDLAPLHRSGGRLHCLKASRGANDSLQCAVVRFNDIVQRLARAMLGIA